jgi:hypothetical protein
MADYIRTVTGIHMTPLEPEEDQIVLEDFAHALSFLCRANGHYTKFYSVGAHCINCYEEAVSRRETARVQMACLLHDATEAYMSDVTRPVKKNMPDYIKFEENLANLIYKKYLGSELSAYESATVKAIDDAMLYYEFYEFTAVRLFDEPPYTAATPDFFQGDAAMVEEKYKTIFHELLHKLEEEAKKQAAAPKIALPLDRLYRKE